MTPSLAELKASFAKNGGMELRGMEDRHSQSKMEDPHSKMKAEMEDPHSKMKAEMEAAAKEAPKEMVDRHNQMEKIDRHSEVAAQNDAVAATENTINLKLKSTKKKRCTK